MWFRRYEFCLQLLYATWLMRLVCQHELCHLNQMYNILTTFTYNTKKVVGFLNVLNLTTVVSRPNIKMLEWRFVYDLCLAQAACTTKFAHDSHKQKSHRLNQPLQIDMLWPQQTYNVASRLMQLVRPISGEMTITITLLVKVLPFKCTLFLKGLNS